MTEDHRSDAPGAQPLCTELTLLNRVALLPTSPLQGKGVGGGGAGPDPGRPPAMDLNSLEEECRAPSWGPKGLGDPWMEAPLVGRSLGSCLPVIHHVVSTHLGPLRAGSKETKRSLPVVVHTLLHKWKRPFARQWPGLGRGPWGPVPARRASWRRRHMHHILAAQEASLGP